MPKLNENQLVLLTAAAQRDNRLVLPLPASLNLDEKGEARILKGLIKSKLIVARPASRREPEWQVGSEGARQTLVITETGLKAINVTEGEEGGTSPTAAPEAQAKQSRTKAAAPGRAAKKAATGDQPASSPRASRSTREGSTQAKLVRTAGDGSQANRSGKGENAARRPGKVDQILALLKRPDGASTEELTGATGWQAHSLRAALTGLRKRDIAVACDRQDGVTRYHVAAA